MASENVLHTSVNTEEFKCKVCQKTYSAKKNLKKHVIISHPDSALEFQPPPKVYPLQCIVCNKNYSKNYHLLAHMRDAHSLHIQIQFEHDCYFCHEKFVRKELLSHYEREHGYNLHPETLKFLDMPEFLSWKESIERSTQSKYILERGGKAYGNSKRYYYVCHRSGVFQSESRGLRNFKTQARSCKIGCLCPASLKVTESSDGHCSVQYMKVHIGHTNDLEQKLNSVLNKEIKEDESLKIATTNAELELLLKHLEADDSSYESCDTL